MSQLRFNVTGAQAVPFAAAPSISFQIRMENADSQRAIQSIALRAQIMIEASRRRYSAGEGQGLRDLFGEKERWSQTLRPLLWTHATVNVPSFSTDIETSLLVPCTFDFNVAAAKYFYALEDDDVPLCFQFSGTVFYRAPDGALRIDQIGWDKESRFRLPSKVWREMMDHYYPDSAWLRLRRDAFDRLYAYKTRHGIASWEETIERLVPLEKEVAR